MSEVEKLIGYIACSRINCRWWQLSTSAYSLDIWCCTNVNLYYYC